MTTAEKTSVYEIVTNQVLAALEQGTVPWAKPWNPMGGHRNLDKRPYQGINPLLLSMSMDEHGFTSPYWATAKAAMAKGGTIRKGSKSTIITFWKAYAAERENENGETEEIQRFALRYYRVFNVEQIDGMKWEAPKEEKIDHDPIAEGDRIIATMPNAPKIEIRMSDQAYYSPARDLVVLPELGQYPKAEDFYRVAFHELVHSTGHDTRLKRDLTGHVMDPINYAAEELVAELGAAMLCGVAGIDGNIEQSAAYIDGWRKALTDDPKLIIRAAGKAQKAADYIIG